MALPCLVGVGALGGFYLSLGPSLGALLLHSDNLLWGGVLIFLLTGLGAAASVALTKNNASAVMLGGCLSLTVGAVVTFVAIQTSTAAVLFVGTAIAGLGFGPGFMGAYRAVVALAPTGDRAALVTAIYIVSYLATAIPAVIGGIATSHYGLHATASVYSLVVAALAASACSTLLIRQTGSAKQTERAGRYPEPPPGPCTVPPCPPTATPHPDASLIREADVTFHIDVDALTQAHPRRTRHDD